MILHFMYFILFQWVKSDISCDFKKNAFQKSIKKLTNLNIIKDFSKTRLWNILQSLRLSDRMIKSNFLNKFEVSYHSS